MNANSMDMFRQDPWITNSCRTAVFPSLKVFAVDRGASSVGSLLVVRKLGGYDFNPLLKKKESNHEKLGNSVTGSGC